jgi:predicted nucleic acid-binding protein
MNRVLIDTNIVVSFFLKEPEFFESADRIFQAIRNRKIVGCISASVITDLYYIIGRKVNEKYAREIAEIVYATFRILTVDRRMVREALDAPMLDFEDAVQAAAAKDYGINIVVTRDKTGFLNSGLQIYSPEEFLKTLE